MGELITTMEWKLKMPIYGARFKKLGDIQQNILGSQEKLTAIIGISVGQDYHEGQKLQAIIQAANQHYAKCIFVIGDSLQRFNYQISGMSALEAYEKAREAGDLWLYGKTISSTDTKNNTVLSPSPFDQEEKMGGNLEAIKQLKIPYEVTRWDEWIFKKADQFTAEISTNFHLEKDDLSVRFETGFLEKRQVVQKLIQGDAQLSNLIEEAIIQILAIKTDRAVSKECAESLVRQYIEEELAVALLWEEKIGMAIFPYPNDMGGKVSKKMCDCYRQLFTRMGKDSRLYLDDIEFFTIKQKSVKEQKRRAQPSMVGQTQNPSLEEKILEEIGGVQVLSNQESASTSVYRSKNAATFFQSEPLASIFFGITEAILKDTDKQARHEKICSLVQAVLQIATVPDHQGEASEISFERVLS